MMTEKLAARSLPSLMTMNNGKAVKTIDDWRARRKEILEILQREEYGYTPAAPDCVRAEIVKEERFIAGKAMSYALNLSFDTPGGEFTFPVKLFVPLTVKKAPVFVNVCFIPDTPSKYMPLEEIIDNGFAIASFDYQDVTGDDGSFDKMAALYPRDEKTGWGAIGMWAFACSRILDYLETRDDIDAAHACVTGHSRLGKTALWCAAQDERFCMAVSNDSGCSGAAISRDKVGESVDFITHRFPYWFCGNYQSWSNREHEMPFDQHMLLALVAPRLLYVCSAEEDTWADPESEYLSCMAASEAWTVQRVPGLIAKGDEMPELNEALQKGGICYHVRPGTHFFSRTDWLFHMKAFSEKLLGR